MSSGSSCYEYLSLSSSDLESCPPGPSEDNIEGYSGEEFIPYDADFEPVRRSRTTHLEQFAIEIEEGQTLESLFGCRRCSRFAYVHCSRSAAGEVIRKRPM